MYKQMLQIQAALATNQLPLEYGRTMLVIEYVRMANSFFCTKNTTKQLKRVKVEFAMHFQYTQNCDA
jgi:hypothetical protein